MIGRATEDAHHVLAAAVDVREEIALDREGWPVLLRPGGDEQLLQLGDGGALDLQIRVLPRSRRAAAAQRRAGVDGAEIDAADGGDAAVGDQYLAVIAIVERGSAID